MDTFVTKAHKAGKVVGIYYAMLLALPLVHLLDIEGIDVSLM